MANNSKDVKSRPAGINDDFQVTVMDINNVIERGKKVLKSFAGKRVYNLSTELTEGMSIKAYDGGIDKYKQEEKETGR